MLQRAPKPILLNAHIESNIRGQLSESATAGYGWKGVVLTLDFANPGDVPILISFPPKVNIKGIDKILMWNVSHEIRTLPPRAIIPIQIGIDKTSLLISKSRNSPIMNVFEVSVSFASGKRRHMLDFGPVIQAAVWEDGSMQWKLLLEQQSLFRRWINKIVAFLK